MPENAVPQVSGSSFDATSATNQAEALFSAQAKVDAKIQEARQAETEKNASSVKTNSVETNAKPATKGMTNIALRYHIDPETNDVTLYILDRASHKVVRTIPPDEIYKLTEGELVELFA